MRSSGGGPALEVSQAGLATVAATMTSAAGSLAALAAAPPVHAPLAADEVSTSAAARLTEHGGVLSSRASDGASVLAAAAQAVLAVARRWPRSTQPTPQPWQPSAVKCRHPWADRPHRRR